MSLVPVVFALTKHCPFGQSLALVGDAPQLGGWDVAAALRLEVSVARGSGVDSSKGYSGCILGNLDGMRACFHGLAACSC